ncbi:hypothetical protein F5Y01DRAFT_104522 [Xylaria sp. FL0043]|nr:hypothetical protein F5Y01DRAFT_104522 [Xylaria sp. FL0043]
MSTPTADMKPFPFNDLPTELRLDIWDHALLAESKNRMILVDGLRRTIYPTKLLVSPFLQVNHESREQAKRFYSHRVRVVEIHPGHYCLPDNVDSHRKSKHTFKACSLCSVGVVYLSTEHDTFCVGFRWPFQDEAERNRLGGRMGGIVFCGITEREFKHLSRSVQKVCSMVNCIQRWDYSVCMCSRFKELKETGMMTYEVTQLEDTWRSFAYRTMFRNVQHRFAIFLPLGEPEYFNDWGPACYNIKDIMTIAENGWEGLRQLTNEMPSEYTITRLTMNDDHALEVTVNVIPLEEVDQVIEA